MDQGEIPWAVLESGAILGENVSCETVVAPWRFHSLHSARKQDKAEPVTTFGPASSLGIMLLLAAIPSASLVLLLAQFSSHGFANGIAQS